MPTSEFKVIDTFLYEEHLSNLDNIEVTTDLNNLNEDFYTNGRERNKA